MNWWLRFRRQRTLERDLEDELAFHREMLSRDENAPAFGNATRVRDSLRDLWRFQHVESVLRDLRFACRALRRQPGFALTIVASLALGIGAAIAIFTAADALLFRALPFQEPDRLMMLWERNPTLSDADHHDVSPDNFLEWKARTTTFADLAVIDEGRSVLRDRDRSEELHVQRVTASFFSLLGVAPARGTGWATKAESTRGADDEVVISDRVWRAWFDGDAGAIGRSVLLDGRPLTIVGVMPAGFAFGDRDVDLWPLMTLRPSSGSRGARSVRAVGRLKPDVDVEQAQAEMTAIADRLAQTDRAFNAHWTVALEPVRDAFARTVRRSLLVLLGAVGLLLAAACINAANLLLARDAARRAEIGLRTALGAGRWRLVQQLLIENLLLAVVAGAIGLAIGRVTLAGLVAMAPPVLTQAADLSIDWRIVLFAVGLSTVTGVAFGLAPSLIATRVGSATALKQTIRRGSVRGGRPRAGLMAAEVAAAMLLLAGASVLVHSLLRMQRVDPGLRADHLLTFHFRINSPKDVPVFARTIERLQRLPGVRSASATSFLPFSGPAATTQIAIEGEPAAQPGEASSATVRTVMPRYFDTIGNPVRRGREFTLADRAPGAPLRFVVNEAFVRRYLAHTDPLGARISASMARTNPFGEIIGVVGDVKEGSLASAPTPTLYYDHARLPYGQMTLLVRTEGDPLAVAPAVRRVVHDLDPGLAVADLRTMDDVVGQTYARERFSAVLMGAFSVFAVLLAAVGVYGVLTYAVSERTSEIGVRLALGAGHSRIVTMVLRDAARFVIPGILAGLAAAYAMASVVASLLFETDAHDPMAFAVAPAILFGVTFVAAYIPANRAAWVDPVKAVQP